MASLQKIRQQYPQYHDMPDDALADALHKKFYADMPRDQFNDKIGFKPGPMSWKDVGSQAIQNVGPSAAKFATSLAEPFMHPVETAKAVGNLDLGLMQKLDKYHVAGALPVVGPLYSAGTAAGVIPRTGSEKYADALGGALKERYGGVENIKRTLATDPVGAVGDASMFLTGGGSALARAPGLASKIGQATRAFGSAIDPIANTARAVKGAGHLAAGVIGDLGTQTGGQSIRTAAAAGARGGESARAFQQNLRQQEPMSATVQEARDALRNIREERGEAYRSGMIPIKDDKTILNFSDIDRAMQEEKGVFKGVETNPSAAEARNKMRKAIEDWKELDPSEYHTAEGLDALKKKIGGIREGIPIEQDTARAAANDVYGAVNSTIRKQAPEYAKVMEGYEEASKQIKELEKTLSLNPNASIDTSLRKLQSALRDNVHTSYGRRKELADILMKAGAPHLMERLAGQALKPWAPRGLAKLLGGELLAGGLGKLLPLMSPRAVGEGAYYAGRAWPYVPKSSAAVAPARIASQLQPREMVRNDAREALRDKSLQLSKDDRDALRVVAFQEGAPIDKVMRVKKLLDSKSAYGGPIQ